MTRSFCQVLHVLKTREAQQLELLGWNAKGKRSVPWAREQI